MIKFVDLDTGNTFNGSQPYTFWFQGEQSINIIYSQPICFISDASSVCVRLEESNIFRLVDNEKLSELHEYSYCDLNTLCTNSTITIQGHAYNNYYVYFIYIIGSADQVGEYITSFYIQKNYEGQEYNNNEEEYKIGADFYGEEESLYINMSNMGIEIPESIQKALYPSPIGEAKRDNILLNRKWKELLSNYWDVIANKGSYKSLLNSLNWFEWGDLVKLEIVGTSQENGVERYNMTDLEDFMTNTYTSHLNNFNSTTYVSLSCALKELDKENGVVKYDENQNPILKNIAFKWSVYDLSLKMSMLGNFYETYFMPIHLDLIHSTIEDIVYADTFKSYIGAAISRYDYVCEYEDVICNVKDGDVFRLSPVRCYVGKDTYFGTQWVTKDYFNVSETTDIIPVGVQKEIPNLTNDDDELKTYLSQLYNEIGAIVDFEIRLPLKNSDEIKRQVVSFSTYDKIGNPVVQTNESWHMHGPIVRFSVLCPTDGDYSISFQFDALNGRTFTKNVKFKVIDTKQIDIKVYKVVNDRKDHTTWNNTNPINDFISGRQAGITPGQTIKQYIPTASSLNSNGIGLNWLLVFNSRQSQSSITGNFIEKPLQIAGNTYYAYLSKKFTYQGIPRVSESIVNSAIKNAYIFVPEYHKLIELGSDMVMNRDDIRRYTVTPQDSLCVIPELGFGRYIEEYEWEFINVSTRKIIKLDGSISEPFIADINNHPLDPGYYDIVFRYRLSGNQDKVNEIRIDSAFKVAAV